MTIRSAQSRNYPPTAFDGNGDGLLAQFIKHTPAAVAVLDNNMRYVVTSDRFLSDYGLGSESIVGQSHYDVFPSILEMPAWLEDHRRCLTGEVIRRDCESFIGPNGKREWLKFELQPWRGEDGLIGGMIMFTEVITTEVEQAEALKESYARFDRAMAASNEGIWEWNLQTQHLYFSPRFKKMFGYAEDEIGEHFNEFASRLHPEDVPQMMAKVEAHIMTGAPYSGEYRVLNKAGEYIWCESRGEVERSADGSPLRMAGCLTIITERKRLEELKREFVYTVTHELRTPLTAMRGAVDMLPQLLGNEVPKRVQNMLDLAIAGSDHLMVLINDLLEVGTLESGQMQFVMEASSLGPILQSSIEMTRPFGEKYRVAFVLEEPQEDATVLVDTTRFTQVIGNLLSNAAKFSPPNSQVEITSRRIGNKVLISVRDHGKGIPESFRGRVFQKFAQEHSAVGSTGLGLSITKTMVEQMQGQIWFESEVGLGTTFHVELPAVQ